MRFMMKKILVLFSIFFLFQTAYSSEVEDWYVMMGMGTAFSSYGDDLEKPMEIIDENVDHSLSLSWDMLGFYFPINNKLMVGPILNATTDNYEESGVKIGVFQYTLGASMQYFPYQINNGFFIRGDLGIAKIVLHMESSEDEETAGSNWGDGFGMLAGAGYALPITDGASVTFSGNLTYRTGEDHGDELSSTSFNLIAGILW